jgi:predicted PurR-regulated permease PerM
VNDRRESRPLTDLLVTLAALVIVIAGLRAASAIAVPLLLAVFIAVIFAQPMSWLRRRGVSPYISLLLFVVVLTALGYAFSLVVSQTVSHFTQQLPAYTERLTELRQQLFDWLESHEIITIPDEAQKDERGIQSVVAWFRTFLAGLTGIFSNALLILVTVIFLLLEATGFTEKLRVACDSVGVPYARVHGIVSDIRRYMAIKTVTSLSTGIIMYLLLRVIGVDYAALWGILAFVLNYVPNIGSFIAAIPAVAVALLQPGLGVGPAIWTVVAYAIVNTVIGYFIELRMMGRGMGLSTLVVLVSLIFWGWVLGPVGMLLAVPLTMAAKVTLEGSPQTRWIAIMMSDSPRAMAKEEPASL